MGLRTHCCCGERVGAAEGDAAKSRVTCTGADTDVNRFIASAIVVSQSFSAPLPLEREWNSLEASARASASDHDDVVTVVRRRRPIAHAPLGAKPLGQIGRSVGVDVGLRDGAPVGRRDGDADGRADVGACVGRDDDGERVGERDGLLEGRDVDGAREGARDGACEVGELVGRVDVGERDGACDVGDTEGRFVGTCVEGEWDVGNFVGCVLGCLVGLLDSGDADGRRVGDVLGIALTGEVEG